MLIRPNPRQQEGYSYVRQYRRADGSRPWALWRVVGGRARRVGTAETEDAKMAHLRGES